MDESSAITRKMKAQKTRDTRCEMSIRRIIHAAGLRYRVDRRPVPRLNRRADIVFPKAKVAVFVDGCFWHGCSLHRGPSKTNTEWWSSKILANQTRDRDTDRRLTSEGWLVLRVWEHEDPSYVADLVCRAVRPSS
jgi:DNA mismatch endonuclease (patch repair protein)